MANFLQDDNGDFEFGANGSDLDTDVNEANGFDLVSGVSIRSNDSDWDFDANAPKYDNVGAGKERFVYFFKYFKFGFYSSIGTTLKEIGFEYIGQAKRIEVGRFVSYFDEVLCVAKLSVNWLLEGEEDRLETKPIGFHWHTEVSKANRSKTNAYKNVCF